MHHPFCSRASFRFSKAYVVQWLLPSGYEHYNNPLWVCVCNLTADDYPSSPTQLPNLVLYSVLMHAQAGLAGFRTLYTCITLRIFGLSGNHHNHPS